MPNAKRASMREGPLAALFRKTAEDTGAPGAPGGDAAPDQPSEATPASSARSGGSGHACGVGNARACGPGDSARVSGAARDAGCIGKRATGTRGSGIRATGTRGGRCST